MKITKILQDNERRRTEQTEELEYIHLGVVKDSEIL
jgi:hypothetical protein